jgi:Flp pilus assembly protein TadD
VIAGVAGVALLATSRAPAPPPAPTVAPVPRDPIAAARRLLAAGDLDGAGRVLAEARASSDGTDLQILLGEVALRRGNRLRALAHFHRATRLGAEQAEPHARLAGLLAQLGQRDAACKEARLALARDGKSAAARAAADAARCTPVEK